MSYVTLGAFTRKAERNRKDELLFRRRRKVSLPTKRWRGEMHVFQVSSCTQLKLWKAHLSFLMLISP